MLFIELSNVLPPGIQTKHGCSPSLKPSLVEPVGTREALVSLNAMRSMQLIVCVHRAIALLLIHNAVLL